MRLDDSLYLDVLAAGGASHNTLSPNGTYTDSFDASRWLASASLTGQWQMGDWTFAPIARVSYFQSTSAAYLDNFGISIPGTTGALGQLAVGPHVSYRFDLGDDIKVQTSLGLDGMLNVTTDDGEASVTELFGKVQAGINFATPGGASFGFSGSYEGLGSSATNSTSGSAIFSVPIN